MSDPIPEEGDQCPKCKVGTMQYPPVVGCSCHISAPCGACTDIKLTCTECLWEFIPEPPEQTYRACGPVAELYTKRPVTELGGGKRLFDYDYDSSSGSTMVWRGSFKGEVTAEDIIQHFGDGTFGHRGPVLDRTNGRFAYTQITD